MTPATPPKIRKWRWLRRGLGALLLLATVLYVGCTGPRDLALYPEAGSSPYRLPWEAGETHRCIQGNRAVVSHRGRDEFAYDFLMPVGTKVCAARSGVVTRVEQSHDGHGTSMPNNLVVVQHGDGSLGWYLHLKQNGALVHEGERVQQGQALALSGNVGRSLCPHLHFHLTDAYRVYQRVTFSDVDATTDLGIPRMFKAYTAAGPGGGG